MQRGRPLISLCYCGSQTLWIWIFSFHFDVLSRLGLLLHSIDQSDPRTVIAWALVWIFLYVSLWTYNTLSDVSCFLFYSKHSRYAGLGCFIDSSYRLRLLRSNRFHFLIIILFILTKKHKSGFGTCFILFVFYNLFFMVLCQDRLVFIFWFYIDLVLIIKV